MKSLRTLIKLHKRELDEQKRILLDLENQKDQLHQALVLLKHDLIKQQQIVTNDPEVSYSYSNYYNKNISQQHHVTTGIVEVNNNMELISSQIYELYAEVKKYEIILANKEKQFKQMQSKNEDAYLDEIAINSFIRKDSDQ
jgi:flagellar biosynthesis chaperone FliJ